MKTVLIKKYKTIFWLAVFGFLLLTGMAKAKPMSGAFIQISSDYNQANWNQEISLMKNMLLLVPSEIVL